MRFNSFISSTNEIAQPIHQHVIVLLLPNRLERYICKNNNFAHLQRLEYLRLLRDSNYPLDQALAAKLNKA